MFKLNIIKWQRTLKVLCFSSHERHVVNTYYSYKTYSYYERCFQESVQALSMHYRFSFSHSSVNTLLVQNGEWWRKKVNMFPPKLVYCPRNYYYLSVWDPSSEFLMWLVETSLKQILLHQNEYYKHQSTC